MIRYSINGGDETSFFSSKNLFERTIKCQISRASLIAHDTFTQANVPPKTRRTTSTNVFSFHPVIGVFASGCLVCGLNRDCCCGALTVNELVQGGT